MEKNLDVLAARITLPESPYFDTKIKCFVYGVRFTILSGAIKTNIIDMKILMASYDKNEADAELKKDIIPEFEKINVQDGDKVKIAIDHKGNIYAIEGKSKKWLDTYTHETINSLNDVSKVSRTIESYYGKKAYSFEEVYKIKCALVSKKRTIRGISKKLRRMERKIARLEDVINEQNSEIEYLKEDWDDSDDDRFDDDYDDYDD